MLFVTSEYVRRKGFLSSVMNVCIKVSLHVIFHVSVLSVMSNHEVVEFFEKYIEKEYQELLPSRWANVAQKLCQLSQHAQRSNILDHKKAESEFLEGMASANILLEQEHLILKRGIDLIAKQNGDQSNRVRSVNLFLESLLSRLSLKEGILQEWVKRREQVSSELLRLYSHSLISCAALVSKNEISRMKAMWNSEKDDQMKTLSEYILIAVRVAVLLGRGMRARFEDVKLRGQTAVNKTSILLNDGWRRTITSVENGANRARSAWHSFAQRVVLYTKYSLISIIVVLAAMVVIVVAAAAFVTVTVTSAATTRFILLRHVPGSCVVPLSFNVLPLITEWWRSDAIDRAVSLYLPGQAPPTETRALHSSTSTLVAERASDLKLSVLQQYVDSIVATSTLVLPSMEPSELLFSPSGDFNYDRLFSGEVKPLFTADGEYAATVQLVLLKEEIGADTSLVLQYAMLYSDEDSWSLPSLKVLFHSSHSVTIRTGPGKPRFLYSLFTTLVETVFYVPLRVYRYLYYVALDNVNSPFPNINHPQEVSVVIPLYTRFTPPVPLRSNLRALNFTVFQQRRDPEEQKIRISRWMFHSNVRLGGLAYWLYEYPFSSFVLLSLAFGIAYGCVLLGFVAVGICLFFYSKEHLAAVELEHSPSSSLGEGTSSASSRMNKTTIHFLNSKIRWIYLILELSNSAIDIYIECSYLAYNTLAPLPFLAFVVVILLFSLPVAASRSSVTMAAPIKIKWGKELLQLEVDPNESLDYLKRKIHELTTIPHDKQKIMGLRVTPSSTTLASMGLVPGKMLMLIGTPEGTVLPTVEAVVRDVEKEKKLSVPLNGITNIGNTCYLNSALQLIRSIPEVKDALASYSGSNPVLLRLGELLTNLDNETGSVVPFRFFDAFKTKYPSFGERDESGSMMQQDSHEALSLLMQDIATALPSKYANLFRGELLQRVKSEGSEPGDEMTVPFTILTCNISGDVRTVESGLEKAFNEEFSTTEEQSQEEKTHSRISRISKAPEYLLIHLTRFSWRGDIQKKTKVLKPITFPLTLDTVTLVTDALAKEQKPVREEVNQRRDDEMEKRKRSRTEQKSSSDTTPTSDPIPEVLHNETGYYELCGVISHKGRGADSGHYIYWGKKCGNWVVYDDENAAIVEEENILRLRGTGESHIAYVLLYRSRDPVTHQRAMPQRTFYMLAGCCMLNSVTTFILVYDACTRFSFDFVLEMAARIKRFDEIDTDSDFDLDEPQKKSIAPTVSFKTDGSGVQAQHEKNKSESRESSILFESLTERRGATPQHPPKDVGAEKSNSAPSLPTELATAPQEPGPSVMEKIPTDTKEKERQHGHPKSPVAAAPVSLHSIPEERNSQKLTRQESDHQVHRDEPLFSTPSPSVPPHQKNSDVLVRARQRLEEKRRSEAYSTPHQSAVPLGSLMDSPEPFLSRSPRGQSSVQRPASVATSSTEGVMRRLAAENNRLHDEVAFLVRENNRYRSATRNIESTDQMKLEITLEMLKKEIADKEESFLESINNMAAERDGFALQLQEAIEQSEGYAAAAAQYEKLYNEKLKDLQALSSKYQVARQELDQMESKKKSIEKNHAERLQIEMLKTEKYKDLLNDAKNQRLHTQQLTVQLQQEVENLTQQCRQLQETSALVLDERTKAKGASEEKILALEREIQIMKEVTTEKQNAHAAELREERRLYDILKQSVKRITQEHRDETESLRRTIDEVREEGKRSVREERQKRLEAESKLQRLELSTQRGQKTENSSSSVVEDLEKRVRAYRDDLAQMRHQRDELEHQLELLRDENAGMKDSFTFYHEQWEKLREDFARSEEQREECERQNKLLSSTVEDLMHNDEVQAARIEELQKQLHQTREASRAPTQSPERRGPSTIETQLLASENERLTEECSRLAIERSNLIEENGKIAAELLNWKNEMRQFVTTYGRLRFTIHVRFFALLIERHGKNEIVGLEKKKKHQRSKMCNCCERVSFRVLIIHVKFFIYRLSGLFHIWEKQEEVLFFARGNSSLGKQRFTFQEALQKDREHIAILKASSWSRRLDSLREYPWKSFIVFMVVWSYLGLYVIPYVKGIPDTPQASFSGNSSRSFFIMWRDFRLWFFFASLVMVQVCAGDIEKDIRLTNYTVDIAYSTNERPSWATYAENVCENGIVIEETQVNSLASILTSLEFSSRFFTTNYTWHVSGYGFLSPTSSTMCNFFCKDTYFNTLFGYYNFCISHLPYEPVDNYLGAYYGLGGDWPMIGLFVAQLEYSSTRGSQLCYEVTDERIIVEYRNFVYQSNDVSLNAQVEVLPSGEVIMRFATIPDWTAVEKAIPPSVGLVWGRNLRYIVETPNKYNNIIGFRFTPLVDPCAVWDKSELCTTNQCSWCITTASSVDRDIFYDVEFAERVELVGSIEGITYDRTTQPIQLDLGFEFEFLGQKTSTLYLMEPGIISLTPEQNCNPLWNTCKDGNYSMAILPFQSGLMWTSGTSVVGGHIGARGVGYLCDPQQAPCPQCFVLQVQNMISYSFSGLSSPFQLSYQVSFDEGGAIHFVYRREGPNTAMGDPIFAYPQPLIGVVRYGESDVSSTLIPQFLIAHGTRVTLKPTAMPSFASVQIVLQDQSATVAWRTTMGLNALHVRIPALMAVTVASREREPVQLQIVGHVISIMDHATAGSAYAMQGGLEVHALYCFDYTCYNPDVSGTTDGFSCSYGIDVFQAISCQYVPQTAEASFDTGIIIVVCMSVFVGLLIICSFFAVNFVYNRQRVQDVHVASAIGGSTAMVPPRRERCIIPINIINRSNISRGQYVMGLPLQQVPLKNLYERKYEDEKN
eukprot:gene3595-2536_t